VKRPKLNIHITRNHAPNIRALTLLDPGRPKDRGAVENDSMTHQHVKNAFAVHRRKLLLASAAWASSCGTLPAGDAERTSSMHHVVLVGDSIFDNAAYVGGGPDVIRQLRGVLPEPWRATLNARDGAVISEIATQLGRIPRDASHLVVSVGGNDALAEASVLDRRARSVAESLDQLADVRDRFQRDYRAMLDLVQSRGLVTAICTIYEARFPDPARRRVAATALTLINDCITREAFARDLTLIDLRLICDSDEDFANAIEPSLHGGEKIAHAIARFATDAHLPRGRVIARASQLCAKRT
jgi:hypothetical protein